MEMLNVNFDEFIDLPVGGDGRFTVGKEGVQRICTPRDRKVDFIVYTDKVLAYVNSAMGYPALYPFEPVRFEAPAHAVLMDLDGTSVGSEPFWVWMIQQSIARLLGDPGFELDQEDEPYVSGHSVSEHLQYCIGKYSPDRTLEEARRHYFDCTRYEMNEIAEGRGRADAFVPRPGLKEFLLTLKRSGVRIGLVTSGLYEKAWPEILSAFRLLDLGDPAEFYDAIITAGFQPVGGRAGTLGELSPKPHPWLYAEAATVGLGIGPAERHRVVGLEDSGAGVVSISLAGFSAIGVAGGNIESSGTEPLLYAKCNDLNEALPLVLGDLPP